MAVYRIMSSVIVAGTLTTAFAQTPDAGKNSTSKLKITDQQFVKHAAAGGAFEVEAAKMAVETATNPDVKEFAQKLQTDHEKAAGKLSSLASAKGAAPSTGLDADHQKKLDQLKKRSGTEFDRAYLQQMLKDHPKDIALFEREIKNGTDSELKAFAEEMIPTLKEHLTMARDLQMKLGATSQQ